MSRKIAPWRGPWDMPRIEREMERWIEEPLERALGPRLWPPFRRGQVLRWLQDAATPFVDIYEEGDTVIVKAEVPGLDKEEIEVSLTGNTLTLKGEKKKEEKIEEKDYYYCERSYGAFSRTVELPTEVQADKITASLKNGIIEIRLPKTEVAKKKEVKVQVK